MNKGVEKVEKERPSDACILHSDSGRLKRADSSQCSFHSRLHRTRSECIHLSQGKPEGKAGCIEPDLNVFTYLRGSRKEKKFHGHNAGNCRAHLEKLLRKIEERGLTSGYDCFLLGVAVHYIADSFTAVHNTDILDVDV